MTDSPCRRSPAYRSWEAMRDRCRPGKLDKKARYFDRGITIDPRWDDFRVFLSDMGERPVGLTLDRKDNSLGYSKENCRWATSKEQTNNRRNTTRLTLHGVTRALTEWSDLIGINPQTLRHRIFRCGWSVERALTQSVRPYQKEKLIEQIILRPLASIPAGL